MDESSKESSGDHQCQEPEAATPTDEASANETPAGFSASATPANKAVGSDECAASGIGGKSTSPALWSPKLGGDEVSTEQVPHSGADESMHGCSEAPKGDAAAPANASTRLVRLALIAASIAAAAAIGSFVGSLSATGVDRLWLPASASAHRYSVSATNNELAEISALKASLEAATRGTGGQLAKLSERGGRRSVDHQSPRRTSWVIAA